MSTLSNATVASTLLGQTVVYHGSLTQYHDRAQAWVVIRHADRMVVIVNVRTDVALECWEGSVTRECDFAFLPADEKALDRLTSLAR